MLAFDFLGQFSKQKLSSMVGGGKTSWDEDSARAVLKSSIVMFGIDLTKSNDWTGKKSPDGKSSYDICEAFDPYELAIFLIGQRVMGIVDDCPIQCYGFGDGSTRDQDVFSFHPQGRACSGFDEVLSCYGEIVSRITPTGPTSLAPIIEMAMAEFEEHDRKYHILLIITDGQIISCQTDMVQAYLSWYLGEAEKRTVVTASAN